MVLHVSVNVDLDVDNIKSGTAAGWAAAEGLRRAKGGTGIRSTEYDFRGVPDGEVWACVHYEYARESAKIAEYVERLREQLRERLPRRRGAVGKVFTAKLAFNRFTQTRSPQHDAVFLAALAGRAGYPRVPWQDLKPEDREALKGLPGEAVEMQNAAVLRNYPVFIGEAVQDAGALDGMTLAAWVQKRTPPAYKEASVETRAKYIRAGFFMVNLGYTPEQLVEEFKRWLFKRHPGASKPPPEKRGRNSYRDRLNALGALRLRFYCLTLPEAQSQAARLKAPPQKKDHGPNYSDRTAWNRACSNAVKYFREVLDVKETDLPIHFCKGWRK